jgi:ssDNA-binding Zn-finger/Zn-ribbon topoisomerase 1
MGFFKKFSAPKAKIGLQLSEVAYNYTDKLTGKIVVDSQENIPVGEFRLEFSGNRKIKWKKGFSSYSSSAPLEMRKVSVGGPAEVPSGQHYEHPFQIDIPAYSIPDPFSEIEIRVKGVATVQGRPDLTNEVKPVITFPYVIQCESRYGGCGFTTQPLPEPVKTCPKCGNNLEELWNRKYSDEARQAAQAQQRR